MKTPIDPNKEYAFVGNKKENGELDLNPYFKLGKDLTEEDIKAIEEAEERENKIKIAELQKAAEPLLKYLCEKHHPHVTCIVTGTTIELLEGKISIPKIFDFVKD